MELHTSRDRYYRRNITWLQIKHYFWPILATPFKTAKTKSSDGSIAYFYGSNRGYPRSQTNSTTYQFVNHYFQTPKYTMRLFSLDPKK